MGKLGFVIMAEFAISAILWLTGISPLIFTDFSNDFLQAGGYSTSNSTVNIYGNFTPDPVTKVQSGQLPGSTLYFGIFVLLFAIGAGTAFAASFINGGNFSVMYLIPAAIIVPLLFIMLSPIATIATLLMINSWTFPIGFIILIFFTVLNMLGIVEFIAGREL